ncbi:nucleoside deaminase [Paenibacillus spongiae]|uniref:Nucleoside deaminase n=1 Tax=Paenibacillus spongiae TaxID=2909671 RepID=A0ABY5SBK9_9BACL|nr:nucleoside deaminase [Paenibacillus spongiae]UVI31342.1 nucleoside deaminase [Paenibacillus spongiae]
MSHLDFIRKAVQLANDNPRQYGGPHGAVIVKNGEIISIGVNEEYLSNDPTAHAETLAVRKACQHLNTSDLSGCVIYASTEPCPMCLSAITYAKIESIYYANRGSDSIENVYRRLLERAVEMVRLESTDS